jgi:hypothetical protein
MARSKTTAPGFRPQFESLDARIVPAVLTVNSNVAQHLAVITANDGNDNITITNNGTRFSVSGTGLAGTLALDPAITTVQVNTNGGNDVVKYNVTGNQTHSMKLEANLGGGKDTFTATQSGANVGAGVAERIFVDGGSGADTISVNAVGTSTNRVNIASGGSLQLKLTGGSNFDLFDGNDAISVDYQGQLKGDLQLQASGGLSNDSLRAAIDLSGSSTGFVHGFNGAKAALNGDLGGDVIDFRVHDHSGGRARVSAEANAGLDLSHDTVRHTTNVSSVFSFGDEDQVVS